MIHVALRISPNPSGPTLFTHPWQSAIAQAGFALVLDQDFDPVTFSGFLPAKYQEVESGFEYFRDSGEGGESLVSFVWHSDVREGICAVIAACGLSQCTGGLLIDDESGDSHSSEAAVDWARSAEAEFIPFACGWTTRRAGRTSAVVEILVDRY